MKLNAVEEIIFRSKKQHELTSEKSTLSEILNLDSSLVDEFYSTLKTYDRLFSSAVQSALFTAPWQLEFARFVSPQKKVLEHEPLVLALVARALEEEVAPEWVFSLWATEQRVQMGTTYISSDVLSFILLESEEEEFLAPLGLKLHYKRVSTAIFLEESDLKPLPEADSIVDKHLCVRRFYSLGHAKKKVKQEVFVPKLLKAYHSSHKPHSKLYKRF